MSRLTAMVTAAGCLSLMLGLASACGGQSFTSPDNGGGTGSTSNAGTGGSGQAGTHTVGGKGGTSHGGTGQGGGVTAGSGGAWMGDACSAPPESGNCEAYFPRWYHDPVSNQCLQFIYGGCGGNDNNYQSAAECEKACGGVSPTACNLPSDCMVGPASCCGVCDGPQVTADQLVAYNRQFAGQYGCGLGLKALPAPNNPGFPGPGADVPVACPPCAAPVPEQATLKYFVPDCVQGQCVVTDLRTSPLTACMNDSECRLRNGTSCCEGCGGIDQYVAVRNDGSFEKAACGGVPQPCPACLPQPPVNTSAHCGATGHCEVAYLFPGGG